MTLELFNPFVFTEKVEEIKLAEYSDNFQHHFPELIPSS